MPDDVPLLPRDEGPPATALLPCADCRHALSRHCAGPEGTCLDCECPGWRPLPPPPDLVFRFRVTGEGPPYILRARRLLKWVWRQLGFRLVRFEEVPREKG